ncbi:hypothetical protein EDC94DRAFT_629427 [Helicostylum pulchrum]|nr:hypothetical protein EDC94DRAFT_629427 [Helicostylum pulchrum]
MCLLTRNIIAFKTTITHNPIMLPVLNTIQILCILIPLLTNLLPSCFLSPVIFPHLLPRCLLTHSKIWHLLALYVSLKIIHNMPLLFILLLIKSLLLRLKRMTVLKKKKNM